MPQDYITVMKDNVETNGSMHDVFSTTFLHIVEFLVVLVVHLEPDTHIEGVCHYYKKVWCQLRHISKNVSKF